MSGNPIPLSLTQPFTFEQPLDMDDARKAARACAVARRQAREWKQRAMQAEADAEHAYRKLRAEKWLRAPGDTTAKHREDWVNAETADARRTRDVNRSIVKAADERLEEIDAERASLHKLVEWSARMWFPAESNGSPRFESVIGGRAS